MAILGVLFIPATAAGPKATSPQFEKQAIRLERRGANDLPAFIHNAFARVGRASGFPGLQISSALARFPRTA
jgi:hypothetical protein